MICITTAPMRWPLRPAFFGTAKSNDTRPVWVPFHFLPGAAGPSFRHKMVCQKDSEVANRMLDFYLSDATLSAHRDHMLHLIGVAAHVYADTFSHYGFSGLSDELNQIQPDSVQIHDGHSDSIRAHLAAQRDNFIARFAQPPIWATAPSSPIQTGHICAGRSFIKMASYRSATIKQRSATPVPLCIAVSSNSPPPSTRAPTHRWRHGTRLPPKCAKCWRLKLLQKDVSPHGAQRWTAARWALSPSAKTTTRESG